MRKRDRGNKRISRVAVLIACVITHWAIAIFAICTYGWGTGALMLLAEVVAAVGVWEISDDD